jgi:ABC-2 type transport system permease protein
MNIMTKAGDSGAVIPARDEKLVVSPSQDGPFAIAFSEIAEAIRLSPVWLHAGWINVLWRFRRTRLGPFWHTLALGGFILTMGTIWSAVLKQDPLQYFRSMSINFIVWSFVASFIIEGTGTLTSAQHTALSMRFPYIAFAFGHVWRALILLAHHSVLYFLMLIATMHAPGLPVLLAIPGFVVLALNGVWLSLLFGIICLRWRDMAIVTSIAMQVLLLATPVFWEKHMLGERLAFAADYNPLYHFLTIVREPLLGNLPPIESWVWSLGMLAVGMTSTLWIYGRYRNRMPYWY